MSKAHGRNEARARVGPMTRKLHGKREPQRWADSRTTRVEVVAHSMSIESVLA